MMAISAWRLPPSRIGSQNATIARIKEQVKAQAAEVQSAEAKVAMAEADTANANAIFERQNVLVKKDFASRQALDTASASRDRAAAAVASAKAISQPHRHRPMSLPPRSARP